MNKFKGGSKCVDQGKGYVCGQTIDFIGNPVVCTGNPWQIFFFGPKIVFLLEMLLSKRHVLNHTGNTL